jgi:hypothetical protein
MKNPCSVSAGRVEDTEQRRNDTLPPSATRILPFLSSRQTMTNDDIEQPSPPEVVVDAATSSYPPLPLLEATLVDDKVYDAVAIDDIANDAFAVCPLWWKRHPKVAVCGLVSVSAVVIAVVAGAAIAISEKASKANKEPSPPHHLLLRKEHPPPPPYLYPINVLPIATSSSWQSINI